MSIDTQRKTLGQLQEGDRVIVSRHGQVERVATVGRALKKQLTVSFTNYSRATGEEIGGKLGRSIQPATDEEIAIAEKMIEQRHAAEEAEEEWQRQAAYDALPEAIKLARKVGWLCQTINEEKLAELPIEHLRGIVAYAEQHGWEVE